MVVSALLSFQFSAAVNGSAFASTEVSKQAGGIELKATNATIKEILDELQKSYRLGYRIPANLKDEPVTVRCKGTLRQVLEHALDGTDHVLKVVGDTIEVVVFGASAKPSAMMAGASSVPPSEPVAASNNANPPVANAQPGTAPVVPAAHSAPPPLANFLHQEPVALNTP